MPMHQMPPSYPKEKLEEAKARFAERKKKPATDGRHYLDFEDFMPPGTVAPKFRLKALDNREISLADYSGSYLVLEVGSYT